MLIPWWLKALALAGIVAGAWLVYDHWRDSIWQQGYDIADAEWRDRMATLQAQMHAEREQRDQASEAIADTTRAEAQQAVQVEQQTTAAAVERVRTVIRTVEVPGNCPTTLPAEVEAEGRAAVARANGAR